MVEYDATEILDLSKEYVIDFSKTDDLTQVLKAFADLDKALYYKITDDGYLEETTNVDEAVIKIVGNKSENKAVITAVNVGSKKEDKTKGSKVKFHGTTVENINDKGILNIIEHLHYSTNNYDFTFKYVEDEVQTKDYKVVEGANQTYTKNKSEDATFKIDADYNLFVNDGKVYVDNILVDSKYYISKAGSTIISLKKEYVDTLIVGEHVVKFIFNDGKEAITTFEIKEEKSSNSNVENPKTGDNIAFYIVTGILSIIGIAGSSIIFYRKKQMN